MIFQLLEHLAPGKSLQLSSIVIPSAFASSPATGPILRGDRICGASESVECLPRNQSHVKGGNSPERGSCHNEQLA